MSNIKALEELKDAIESCRLKDGIEIPFDSYWITADACDALLKKLEAEIAERFMEPPVDADGVPIRVGDKLVNGVGDGIIYTVAKLKFDGRYWWYESGDNCFSCDGAKHKHRTLEDVLEDFAIGVCEEDGFSEEHVRCCADEIRAMFGEVDA